MVGDEDLGLEDEMVLIAGDSNVDNASSLYKMIIVSALYIYSK